MVVKAPREILDMNPTYLGEVEQASFGSEDSEDGVEHLSEQAINYVIRGGNGLKVQDIKDEADDEPEEGQVCLSLHRSDCLSFYLSVFLFISPAV
jgi:hypothetical protein